MIKVTMKALEAAHASGELMKYPHKLTNEAWVIINPDDYLGISYEDPASTEDLDSLLRNTVRYGDMYAFFVRIDKALLPPYIYIYGKGGGDPDLLYVNYWIPLLTKVVKSGYLTLYCPLTPLIKLSPAFDAEVINLSEAWCAGLPPSFRRQYLHNDLDAIRKFVVSLLGGSKRVTTIEGPRPVFKH